MKYLILVQFSLTVGIIVSCYAVFAIQIYNAIINDIKESVKIFLEKNKNP